MASYTYANLGQEFLVNTKTAGDQQVPHVAALVNGGFVMIWDDVVNASNDFDVRGQRYDANGNKVGGEFLVNSTTTGLQGLSMVTSLASGGFVVSWTDNSSGTNDVRAQLYDAAGAKVGGAILVNTATAGEQLQSSLASLDTGGFVATWRTSSNGSADSLDLKGQVFDATGAKVGGEFTVSTDAFQQSDAVVDSFSSGRFAVAWTSATASRVGFVDPGVVKVQLFESNGAKLGAEITVAAAADTQARPAIAVLSGGGFVVTWQQAGAGGDGSEYGIKAQLFDANGAKVGAEFLANTTTANTQELARVTALDTGGFIVSWSDETGDGSQYGVKAQIFSASGAKVGSEFLVNSATADDQIFSTVAQLANGRVVFGWEDHSGGGGDADAGIKAQLVGLFNAATITGTANADTLNGTTANDAIEGLDGNDTLNGGARDDILVGGAGNDTLNGGADIDRLDGGAGDDTYIVDHARDTVVELAGGGNDTVFSQVDYVLQAGVAAEILSAESHAGTGALNLTGNELANFIYGNAGRNILDGGAGADTLTGFGGDDTYYVEDLGDRVVETSGGGNDIVYSRGTYRLAAGVEVETLSSDFHPGFATLELYGNEFANTLLGNQGRNYLEGGGGADTLTGFAGDDFYAVDTRGDRVIEDANGGTDTVYTSVTYVLEEGQHIEILSSDFHAGTGTLELYGNSFANTIYGNAGRNYLVGGGGDDVLIGLGGDDFYAVDSRSDRVIEDANGGTDTVYTSVTYVLEEGQHVEVLSSDFHAGTTTLELYGNSFANTIYGNAGRNYLVGGGGIDTLIGFAGDDDYLLDNAADQIIELAGDGFDRAFSSTSYTLAADARIELLSTDVHALTTAINLNGNGFDNQLYGNAGINTLDGKGGNDLLVGFGGADRFQFTTALNATTNVDRIETFETGLDKIALDDAIFTGLGLGALPAGAFQLGGAATQADDRIIYNQTTGALFFDADGSGAGAAVQFALLENKPADLSATDFVVI